MSDEAELSIASQNVLDLSEKALNGKRVKALVVGPTGAGKSTLVNSLLVQNLCIARNSTGPVTTEVEPRELPIRLKSGGTAFVDLYDSPGFKGGRSDNDAIAERELRRKIPSPDLILHCFDISSGWRFMPCTYDLVINKMSDIYYKRDASFVKKTVIVLTKGNVASHRRKPTDEPFCKSFEDWKKAFRKEYPHLAEVPIIVAGMVNFTASGKPDEITPVDGTKKWLGEIWNTAATVEQSGESGVAAILLAACRNAPLSIRAQMWTTPSSVMQVLIFIGLSVAIAPLAVAGPVVAVAAVGATAAFAATLCVVRAIDYFTGRQASGAVRDAARRAAGEVKANAERLLDFLSENMTKEE